MRIKDISSSKVFEEDFSHDFEASSDMISTPNDQIVKNVKEQEHLD